MNAVATEPQAWSPARRWSLIVLVFAAHLGLIFALSDRKPLTLRPPASAPLLSLASGANELLELNDPALFALPQRRSFAGAAWLNTPEIKFQPFRWAEPARLLPLPVAGLGAAFARFVQTNTFAGLVFETKPAPDFPQPVAPEFGAPPSTHSVVRVAGELAKRRLLHQPELPAQAAADVLTPTVAEVLATADGSVLSLKLLASSGNKAADQLALKVARAARFEPVRGGGTTLTLGTLVFEWRTVPLPVEPKPAP